MKNLRHEIKYQIHQNEFEVIHHQLSKLLKRDQHGHDGSYTVSSLYYDDVFHSGYYDKLDGLNERHKYRIRYYDQDYEHLKFERKSKFGPMTKKEGLWIQHEKLESELLKLSSQHPWLLTFTSKTQIGIMRPSSFIRYERIAYFHEVGNLRITFDQNVRGTDQNLGLFLEDHMLLPLLEPGVVIMEIKFEGVYPDFLRGILASGTQMAESTSKYVFSKARRLG